MKKYLKIIVLGIIVSLSFTKDVNAASANISVSKSANQIVVGQSVKFTVTISSSSPLGSWDFDVVATGGTLTAGQGHIVDYAASSNQKSKSYSYTVRANSKGTINLRVRNSLVYGFDLQKMSVSNGSSSVKVITKADLEATYSDNNNLKNLTVEGYQLTPSFNKNTLEYSVELPTEIEKINVIATKEDSRATVTGGGEINVSEGDNKIEIIVLSQKGTKKTYTINATVIDKNPIEVTMNEQKYTVVKKIKDLTMPDSFEETTINIADQEIPGFYNEQADIYLVGLKDDEGNSGLYIYNEEKHSYTLYQELKANNTIIAIDKEKFDNKLIEVTIKFQDQELKAYKYNKNSKFAYIYGMNLETGKESWYMYDETEATFQRYNDEQIKEPKEMLNTFTLVIGALGISLLITFIIIVILIVNNRKRKKLYEKNKELKKEKNKTDNKTKKEKKDETK